MTIKDICEMVQDHLDECNNHHYVSFADWDLFEDFLEINIEWGDWKHDHARTRCQVLDVVQNIPGFVNWTEDVTESDGSDCYSARHRFYFKKERLHNEPIVLELGTI